ncbi:unnamed protein product [Moneuplotes crassus]|uniref:Uncharacterized protein n=1 Tax=Euplotes crassus TaxID=5936 RepID=A0AAD1XCL4_EUPCR|nr:unnamed protein product [Moneuplotes crassus]
MELHDESQLNLNLSQSQNAALLKDLLKLLDGHFLPDLKKFWVHLYSKNNKLQTQLIHNHFPKHVGALSLINKGTNGKVMNIEPFKTSFHKISPCVLKALNLGYFKIPASILSAIFDYFAHIEILGFQDCAIDASGVCINKHTEFEISELGFIDCGGKNGNDWATEPEDLWKMVQEIGKSPMVEALEKLVVWKKGDLEEGDELLAKNIRKMLDSNQLDDVELDVKYCINS